MLRGAYKYLIQVGVFAGLTMAVPAYGLISVQAEVGSRSGKIGTSDAKTSISGTELDLGAQIDPIPLVPVGFGLTLSYQNLKFKDSDYFDKYSGLLATPFVWAWLPNPTDFKPFLRLGYTIYGKMVGSGKQEVAGQSFNTAQEDSVTGSEIGVGVNWAFLPLVSIMLEYQMAQHKAKPTKLEIAYADAAGNYAVHDVSSDAETMDFKSSAILVGVDVGL